jgi:hypothetical protein
MNVRQFAKVKKKKKIYLPFPNNNIGVARIHRQCQFCYLSSIRMCYKECSKVLRGMNACIKCLLQRLQYMQKTIQSYITFFLIFSTLIIAAYRY